MNWSDIIEMNILLIVLMIIMIWRIAVGGKRGVVRETISLINVFFVSVVLGVLGMIFEAYHEKAYITIVLYIIIIVALSVVYSMLKVVFFSAKILSKLPVIGLVDRLLGVVIGVGEALCIYWAVCCLIMYMDLGVIGQQIMEMIAENEFLTFLYKYNLLGLLLETIKSKI